MEIESREALLSFGRDPERTFRFVTERLGRPEDDLEVCQS